MSGERMRVRCLKCRILKIRNPRRGQVFLLPFQFPGSKHVGTVRWCREVICDKPRP
jgi:hypothetical protein